MTETTPPSPSSPSEKTVIVTDKRLCRLWTLTITSLALNGLILLLLVAGAIIHHHRHHGHGFAGRDGRGGHFCGYYERDCDRHFHHFGGPGTSGPDGFGEHRRDREGFRGGNGGQPFTDNDRDERGPKGPPDPAKMTDMMLDHLTSTLTLTDDQKARIRPIIQDQVTQMQKDREAQRTARQKAMEDTRAKIRPLLNPDQQKQLDALPLPGQKSADQAKEPDEKPAQ